MARAWKFGDDLDTDQILPGRYAPFMTGQDKFHAYAFHDARPEFATTVKPGDVLVGGDNFGCGSSREYAVAALTGVIDDPRPYLEAGDAAFDALVAQRRADRGDRGAASERSGDRSRELVMAHPVANAPWDVGMDQED